MTRKVQKIAALAHRLEGPSSQEYLSFISDACLHHPDLHACLFSFVKQALNAGELSTPFQKRIAYLVGVQCTQFKEQMTREEREVLDTILGLYDNASAIKHISSVGEHILCAEVSVGGKADTDGNSSADISVREQSDDGRFSGSASAGVSRDSEGNTKGTVEGRITWEFNN